MGLLKPEEPEPEITPENKSQQIKTLRRPRFADLTKRKGRVPGALANGENKYIASKELFKRYTKKEQEALSERYTDEQIKVIHAGEEAIAPEDLKSHGIFREGRYSLPYLDDLSTHNPLMDRKISQANNDTNEPFKFLDEDGQREVISDWITQIRKKNQDDPEWAGPSRQDWMEFMADGDIFLKRKKPRPLVEFTKGGQKHVLDTVVKGKPDGSVVNFSLPKTKDPTLRYKKKVEAGDDEGIYTLLKKQTGMSLKEIQGINVKVLVSHRVVNQTRLGKIQSQYMLAVAGNGKGLLGIGEGKSKESLEAGTMARLQAIRNMKPVPMYENRTIYGEVYGKVSAAEVSISARPPGFGLRVQQYIFEMARAAGIQDLAARVTRSRNPMNTVKAAYAALMSQRIPEEVAMGRGRKLVDVRKVYYMGRNA